MNNPEKPKLTIIPPVDDEAIQKWKQEQVQKEEDIMDKEHPVIIINGKEYHIFKDQLSYDEIIAFTKYSNNRQVTVQFTRGSGKKSSGTVLPNQSVDIIAGMVIDAVPTGVS